MFRGVGDDGEQDVPEVLFEIEVETEMSTAEVEGGPEGEVSTGSSRPHSPVPNLLLMVPPVSSGTAFGEWLFDVMGSYRFLRLKERFADYDETNKLPELKRLVKFGNVAFQRNKAFLLYFLEGLHLIAVSLKHKRFINQVYRVQLHKILPRED